MGSRVFTVYFRNIPETYDVPEFTDIFVEFGEILKLFVHHSRTYGMVEYADISSCNKAIESLHNVPPLMLFVTMARSNPVRKDKQTRDTDGESICSTSSRNDMQYNRNNDSMDNFDQEKIFYVDRFNKIIHEVFVDEEGVVYVPVDRVTGVKRFIKKNKASADDFYHNPESYMNLDNVEDNSEQRTNKNHNSSPAAHVQNKPERQHKFLNGTPGKERSVEVPAIKKHADINEDNWTESPMKNDSFKKDDSFKNHDTYKKEESLKNNRPYKKNELKKKNNRKYPPLELPLHQFVQVNVVEVLNERCAWVQLVSDDENMADLVSKMMTEAETADPISPTIGQLVLAKFDGIWFRAEVLATTPRLHVRFIDFGNDCYDPEEGARVLSQKSAEHRAMAAKIILQDGAPIPLKADLILYIKPVNCDADYVYSAQLENGIYSNEESVSVNKPIEQNKSNLVVNSRTIKPISPVPPVVQASKIVKQNPIDSPVAAISRTIKQKTAGTSGVKSLVPNLKVNHEGIVDPVLFLKLDTFIAAFLPHEMTAELTELQMMTNACPADPSFRPAIGDLVAALLNPEGWCRAILLERSNDHASCKVAFVDYGREATVNELRPVPSAMVTIPWFTGVCTVPLQYADKFNQPKEEISFRVLSTSGEQIKMQFSGEFGDICQGEVAAWIPSVTKTPIEPETTPVFTLASGDKVQLVCESDGFIYVRTRKGADLLKKITRLMSDETSIGALLSFKPKPAQLVAAFFDDGWYRAVVSSVQDDLVNILYVDYGNEETLSWNKLKVLSAELKQLPFTLFKVKLTGIAVQQFTLEQLQWLAELAESKSILTVTFDGAIENGVTLTTRDGKDIAIQLEKLCEKSLKKKHFHVPEINDPRVLIEHLPQMDLGSGNRKIRVLEVLNPASSMFSFCRDDEKALNRVHVSLAADIKNYVESVSPFDVKYKPNYNEVVLACKQGQWRRALFTEMEEGECSIFYVDYGEMGTVHIEMIRRISPDFVDVEAIAYFGSIDGVPEELNERAQLLLEKIMCSGTILDVSVISKDENDVYIMKVPSVVDALRSNKLI